MDSFQNDKITFSMLGRKFNYEFLPSIHLQEVMVGITSMLTNLSFDLGKDDEGKDTVNVDFKNEAILPQAMQVVKELLSVRIYQVIADVLQHQNGFNVTAAELKVKTRATEISAFMDILIQDPEIYEAITGLGKSLTALIGKMSGLSATEKSTPSLPATSDSTESTSTNE